MRNRLCLIETWLREAHARLWSDASAPWLEAPAGFRRGAHDQEWFAPALEATGARLRLRVLPEALRHATFEFWRAFILGGGQGARIELALFHGRGCAGAVIDGGTVCPLNEVWIQGPRMERWFPAESVPDLRGDVAAHGQFSRYAGAFGGERLHERLCDLPVAVVGVSRVGSLLAVAPAKAGVRRLVFIDPDLVEPHHLEAFEGPGPLVVGEAKVDAAARHVPAAWSARGRAAARRRGTARLGSAGDDGETNAKRFFPTETSRASHTP